MDLIENTGNITIGDFMEDDANSPADLLTEISDSLIASAKKELGHRSPNFNNLLTIMQSLNIAIDIMIKAGAHAGE